MNCPPSPKARAQPIAQYATPPMKASRVFFSRILTVFFVLTENFIETRAGFYLSVFSYLTDPASKKAKPACMKNMKRETMIKKN